MTDGHDAVAHSIPPARYILSGHSGHLGRQNICNGLGSYVKARGLIRTTLPVLYQVISRMYEYRRKRVQREGGDQNNEIVHSG